MSDIDIGILVQQNLSHPQLWRLEDEWLAEWGVRADLRILNLAPLSFQYEVTARGQRLWTANAGDVANIESLIWRKYWDLRPRLEQDIVCRISDGETE